MIEIHKNVPVKVELLGYDLLTKDDFLNVFLGSKILT